MKLYKNNFRHINRVAKISYKLDIPEVVIEEALDIMYGYIRMKINEIDIDENRLMSEKEFKEKFPVISIPSMGFLKPNYRKYKHIMKYKIKKNEKKH